MKPHKKTNKPISDKQCAEDDKLRDVLRNADLKKFGEALRKVVIKRPLPRS
jgi:hypothetical protein